MAMKLFTEEEQRILRENPYTLKVSDRVIFFTKNFKEQFAHLHHAGSTPREAVTTLGYDPEILGTARLSGLQIRMRKHDADHTEYTEGTRHGSNNSNRLEAVDPNPGKDTIVKMQHELLYQRQEIEFLKKSPYPRTLGSQSSSHGQCIGFF
jgi:hypothetical protein